MRLLNLKQEFNTIKTCSKSKEADKKETIKKSVETLLMVYYQPRHLKSEHTTHEYSIRVKLKLTATLF